MRINRAHRTIVDGEPAPDRNDEYRFYQAVVGVWPPGQAGRGAQAPADLVERLRAYMLKAAREAKLHTSWITPNPDYENALDQFIERTLRGAGRAKFIPALLPLQQRIAAEGLVNSLAQVALKIGSPGVPDFYQGSDLWDFSLVDPDNRRPVDFELRDRLLAGVESVLSAEGDDRVRGVSELLANWADGRIKLLLTTIGLRLRREMRELFLHGEYVPLATEITVHADVVAFARALDDAVVIVAAPRLTSPLQKSGHVMPLGGDAWKTSRVMLPERFAQRTFRNGITGAGIRPTTAGSQAWLFVGQLFETVPVAWLRAV
jgi:(1->4)-alpha-D-glucan 1-alpha-D-glucosylmutase